MPTADSGSTTNSLPTARKWNLEVMRLKDPSPTSETRLANSSLSILLLLSYRLGLLEDPEKQPLVAALVARSCQTHSSHQSVPSNYHAIPKPNSTSDSLWSNLLGSQLLSETTLRAQLHQHSLTNLQELCVLLGVRRVALVTPSPKKTRAQLAKLLVGSFLCLHPPKLNLILFNADCPCFFAKGQTISYHSGQPPHVRQQHCF